MKSSIVITDIPTTYYVYATKLPKEYKAGYCKDLSRLRHVRDRETKKDNLKGEILELVVFNNVTKREIRQIEEYFFKTCRGCWIGSGKRFEDETEFLRLFLKAAKTIEKALDLNARF